MSPTENCELVRRGAAAFSAGDVATLREVLAPDVVHVVPGSGALAGSHEGIAEVSALYGRLTEISGGTFRLEVRGLFSDGAERVVLAYRSTARRYGHALDSENALVCTLAAGRIVRLEDFAADVSAYDEFWG